MSHKTLKTIKTVFTLIFIIMLIPFCINAAENKDTAKSRGTMGPEFDKVARGVNAPVYDYYAELFKEKSGITNGVCLDAGAGGGYLGLSIAAITDLEIIFLDIDSGALETAKKHIIEDGIENRAKTLLADIHNIPLQDNSVDLVVSRGSIWFWDNPGKALKEIYRVLKPGGKAYIGGGKGSPEIQEKVDKLKKKLAKMPQQNSNNDKNSAPLGIGERMQKKIDYRSITEKTGIKNFDVIKNRDDFYGMWIYLWK